MGTTNNATITWNGADLSFQGQLGSGYTLALSSPASLETGGSPMELLLAGVAGCTAIDVVNTLQKMRQPLTGLEVEIQGERAETHPKVYTAVEIVYVLQGEGLEPQAIERAIALSEEKYCSASAILQRSGTPDDHFLPDYPKIKPRMEAKELWLIGIWAGIC